MTKKIMIMAAAIAAAAMVFTACDSKSENSDSIDSGVISEISDGVVSDDETVTDEIEDEDILPEDTEDLDEVVDDLDEITEDENVDDDFTVESSNPLMPMVESVLNSAEWPYLEEITDSYIISEYFTLDAENANYNELIVMQCPMSAVMSEIIIINAEDTDAAKADLDARRQKAIDTDAWYPDDQVNAENSIVGVNGSYVYFIIGNNAAEGEQALNDYIDAL